MVKATFKGWLELMRSATSVTEVCNNTTLLLLLTTTIIILIVTEFNVIHGIRILFVSASELLLGGPKNPDHF